MDEQKCEKCGMPITKEEDKCTCKGESTCYHCCECNEDCNCGCKKRE